MATYTHLHVFTKGYHRLYFHKCINKSFHLLINFYTRHLRGACRVCVSRNAACDRVINRERSPELALTLAYRDDRYAGGRITEKNLAERSGRLR